MMGIYDDKRSPYRSENILEVLDALDPRHVMDGSRRC